MKIVDVQFLTPARVKEQLDDGQKVDYDVNIDIVNRKVYRDGTLMDLMSDAVFAHLDEVNTLPEDFFAASEEIHEQAALAQEAHEKLKQYRET